MIPSWERAGLLPDAIESALAQDWSALQIIVVDDGSTDNTREVVSRYPNVEYIYQSHAGSAAARNTGIAHASGRYVAFLDSDDLWLPGKVRAEMKLFETYSAARAIISDSEHWLGETQVRVSRFEATLPGSPGEPWFLPRDSTRWVDVSLFSTCCLTVESALLDSWDEPVFDTSLGCNEDWDFEIRMYAACEVLVCPRVLAKVRRYPDNTRGGRALPGTLASWEQLIGAATRHRTIMRRALRLPSLTTLQREKIEAKIALLDARIQELQGSTID